MSDSLEEIALARDTASDRSGRHGKRRRVLVCAWCRARLEPGPSTCDEVENFGICSHCLSEQLLRAGSAAATDTPGR